jgi:hypothetical protein
VYFEIFLTLPRDRRHSQPQRDRPIRLSPPPFGGGNAALGIGRRYEAFANF